LDDSKEKCVENPIANCVHPLPFTPTLAQQAVLENQSLQSSNYRDSLYSQSGSIALAPYSDASLGYSSDLGMLSTLQTSSTGSVSSNQISATSDASGQDEELKVGGRLWNYLIQLVVDGTRVDIPAYFAKYGPYRSMEQPNSSKATTSSDRPRPENELSG
jgi:hypothetical protein